jgi:two-component system, OmpR family, alkaline phosphatase synthesis response regulator PhoP
VEEKKIKIIFAEDDVSIARLVIFRLNKEGYEVIHFKDGEHVVQNIRIIKPHLILLDRMMPIKNGLTILREIKSDDAISDIPVIFLTSESKENSIEDSIKLGAADYIIKPFSTNDLLLRIKKALYKK